MTPKDLLDQARRRIHAANCLDFSRRIPAANCFGYLRTIAILKNLSEQDIYLDSKDLIDCERNAVDLNDQRDSKEQLFFTSFKIWNILDKIFVPIHVQPHALSTIQQLQVYAIVFRNVLASNRISAVEEAQYNPLIGHEDFLWTMKQQAIFGCMVGKSSRQPYAQQGLGSFRPGTLRLERQLM